MLPSLSIAIPLGLLPVLAIPLGLLPVLPKVVDTPAGVIFVTLSESRLEV